jgi:hypothetical protein
MRGEKEIRADFLAALSSVGDEVFTGMGFQRRKGSLSYVRVVGDAQQAVTFDADYLPKYQLDEELHIHPAMRLAIGSVTEAAMQLVAGNKMLLANSPDIIVNQPIEFTAPKAEHVRWFASGADEMKERVVEIVRFIQKWVVPFLDQLTTSDELIDVYKTADDRMMKQRHWYLFVAAAYMLKGDNREALSVLECNLGAPGLRKRYAVAFEAFRPVVKT